MSKKKKPLTRLTTMLLEASAMYQRNIDKRTEFQLKYISTYEGYCIVLNHALSRAPALPAMELTTTSVSKLGLPNANISGLLIRMEELGLLRTVREQVTPKGAVQNIYAITAYGEKYEGIYRKWREAAEHEREANPKRSHHKKRSGTKEYISRRTLAEMDR